MEKTKAGRTIKSLIDPKDRGFVESKPIEKDFIEEYIADIIGDLSILKKNNN